MKAAVAILGVLCVGLALALLVQTADLSKLGRKHDEVLKQLEKTEVELRDAKKKIELLEQAGEPDGVTPPAPDQRQSP